MYVNFADALIILYVTDLSVFSYTDGKAPILSFTF